MYIGYTLTGRFAFASPERKHTVAFLGTTKRMPTNLYPAPFAKWHQGPIVLPAPPSHAPLPEYPVEAMSMMSAPTMQQHMSPVQTFHQSIAPMSRHAPGAVLTNGMASKSCLGK